MMMNDSDSMVVLKSQTDTEFKKYTVLFIAYILLLISACAPSPQAQSTRHATNDNREFTEYEYDGIYGLSYIDHSTETLQWFGSRGLQGGGYTWEALVRATFEL